MVRMDFSHLFDSIWRNGLWVKLWHMGIKGKFWRILKDFYRKTCVKIRINGKFSEEFQSEKGVKQGGVLSPSFFAIYIDDLIKLNWMSYYELFADDMALLSPSHSNKILYMKSYHNPFLMLKIICVQFYVI